MENWLGKRWNSYFYSGAIVLIISWLMMTTLSGCRFGNHETYAPTPNPVSGNTGDTVSGFYATAPQSLEVFATHDSSTTSSAVSATQLPSEISSVLTDPVTFDVQNLSTGEAYFYPPDNANANLPVYLNKDQSFGINGAYPAQTAWDDPACTLQELLTIQGTIQPLGSTPSPATYKTYQLPLSGRLQLTVQLEYKFLPDQTTCAASLQKIYNCHQDLTQCPGSTTADQTTNQEWTQALFDPMIQAGVMTAQDIQTTSNVAYQASFQ